LIFVNRLQEIATFVYEIQVFHFHERVFHSHFILHLFLFYSDLGNKWLEQSFLENFFVRRLIALGLEFVQLLGGFLQ
jgi:hypothetical protein